MVSMTVTLRGIPDTKAALGWAGAHSLVVDRPDGTAGGQGLGFNGGQLLALAVGGCLCNDLQLVAHEAGVELASIAVDVTMSFEGEPLLATSVAVQVSVEAADRSADVDALVRKAVVISTVGNSISRGVSVNVTTGRPAN